MCKNARLNWLLACAGIAAAATAAVANGPVPGGDNKVSPQVSAEVGNPASMMARKAVTHVNPYVDDMEALELANKLGLTNPVNPGALRGLQSCPNILTDGFNCHVASLELGANFSGTAPGALRTADSVTPITQNPDRICWIGRYANRVSPPVANESFQIRIFNRGPDGLPDLAAGPIFTRIFQQTGTAGNDLLEMNCLDGETCPGTTNPATGGHFVYSVQVNGGFPMNANTCYFIEIANVGSTAAGVNWGWVGSQTGSDLESLQAVDGNYTVFTRAQNDRALCVSGGIDAFNGACVLPPRPPICEFSSANGIEYDGNILTGFFASVPPSPQVTWPDPANPGWNSFQIAENFAFGSATTVDGICFEGFWQGYQNGDPVAVQVPQDPGFRVTYFTNSSATGVPGAPVAAATFQVGDPGVELIWDNDGDIRIMHPPVQFAASQCYWVSIGRIHNQPNPAQAIPVFHWLATGSSATHADDRFAARSAATAAGGVWGGQSFPIEGSIQNCNINFRLSSGPVVQQSCLGAACSVPAGGTAEGEANCGMPNDTINGGCNSASFVVTTIACGQTRRGTIAVDPNAEIRDTDWYQFTLAQPQDVTITFNAEFPNAIVGYIGDVNGPIPAPINCAAEIGVNPAVFGGLCEPVTLVRTLPAGTWTIFVSTEDGSLPACNVNGGEYLLTVNCAPPSGPPANDLCANAVALNTPCAGSPVTVNGTTLNATNDNQLACGTATQQTAGGVWYTVVGNGSPITADLCTNTSYDAQIGVFSGACGSTVCVGGDDDGCGAIGGPSSITWNSVAGTTYRILVHGWNVSAGPFTLTLTSDGSCGGEDCNQNGTPDSQEIAGNPALDCWNGASPSGVTGGPDGDLDVCQCTGNFNRDGAVNSADISSFLNAWLLSVQGPNTNADIDCSGSTNSADISAFLNRWLANVQGTNPFDGCP